MCHCTGYKLLALQVRIAEENTPNATIQQFVTAKISGGTVKQERTTHSSIRQSNFQRKNEASLMSCRIRALSKCGWTGWSTPRFEKSNLAKLNKNRECT